MIKVEFDINDILQSPQNITAEHLPTINAQEFEKVITTRRSVRIFTKERVPEDVMHKAFDWANLSPSASNFCPWEFYWVHSDVQRAKLVDYCLQQPAATTAGELVVCVVRTKTWDRNRKAIIKFIDDNNLKIPNCVHLYYNKITYLCYKQGLVGEFGLLKKICFTLTRLFRIQSFPPCGEKEMLLWASKNGALAQQTFMLSLRALGYDSCAMEGFDSKRIGKMLKLPHDAHISMVIGVGKRDPLDQVFGPRIRMDRSWHIKVI